MEAASRILKIPFKVDVTIVDPSCFCFTRFRNVPILILNVQKALALGSTVMQSDNEWTPTDFIDKNLLGRLSRGKSERCLSLFITLNFYVMFL